MNKKAGVPDGIFYVVAIFAVAIIIIVGFLVMTNIDDHFQESSAITGQGKSLMSNMRNEYVSIMDNSFLIIFIGVLLGTVVGVWFIKAHPALFWIMIPIFAFIIFLAAIYANVFWNISNNEKIIDSASEFTYIPIVMNNFAYVITAAVILIAVALFAKGKGEPS